MFSQYAPREKALAWWEAEIVPTVVELLLKREEEIPVNGEALRAMRDPPVCLKNLRRAGPPQDGTRNKCQILDATYSLHHGETREKAIAAIDSWTEVMPGDARKQSERRDSTRRVVKTIYDNAGRYKFYCAHARSLDLVTFCDCQSCPLYNKHDLRKQVVSPLSVAEK